MKCPRCQNDNYEGARFCTGCGFVLPRESKAKKFIMTLLHAVLYFALYVLIQQGVSLVYELMLISEMTGQQLLLDGTLGKDTLQQIMNDIYALKIAHQYSLLLLSGLITVLVLFLVFRIRKKDPLKEMHIRRVPLARVPWYVLLGVSLQPATWLFLELLPQELLEDFAVSNPLNYTSDPLVVELITAIVIVPIAEELIFRALMFTRLRRGTSAVIAILLIAGIFGFVHGHPVSFIYASVLGVVLAWLMLKNNTSVISPILCHAGFNAGNYLFNLILGNTPNRLLNNAVMFSSLALLVLCIFMTFRPIEAKE